MKSKCHYESESNRNKSNPNSHNTYLDSAIGIRVMSSTTTDNPYISQERNRDSLPVGSSFSFFTRPPCRTRYISALISNSCRGFYPASVKTREPWNFSFIWICRRNPHSAKLCLQSPTILHEVTSTEAEITLYRCPQIGPSTFLPVLQSKWPSCTVFQDSGQLRCDADSFHGWFPMIRRNVSLSKTSATTLKPQSVYSEKTYILCNNVARASNIMFHAQLAFQTLIAWCKIS